MLVAVREETLVGTRQRLRVSLLSVLVLVGTASGVPAAAAAPPPPVTNVGVSAWDGGYIAVSWTAPTETTPAVVCEAPGSTPPVTPSDAGATCSAPIMPGGSGSYYGAYSFTGVGGQQYAFSVFSYDPATGEYGPPASVTVTAVDPPPQGAVLRTTAVDGRTLTVVVQGLGEASSPCDVRDALVSWAPGMAIPPAPSPQTGHVVPVSSGPECYPYAWQRSLRVTGLNPGVLYTFAVRLRDHAGQVGDPTIVRATTRVPGLSETGTNLSVRSLSAPLECTEIQKCRGPGPTSAAMPSPGVIDAAYEVGGRIVFATLSPTSGWSTRTLTTVGNAGPYVATGPNGFVVVAWTNAAGAYYEYRSAGRWSGANRIMAGTVLGVTTDAAARIHLLIDGGGLWYVTNGSGRWTSTKFASSHLGLLARDPATNRIVVVYQHVTSSDWALRVATMSATVAKPGIFATWLSPSQSWTATSVAASGGRIVVALVHTTSWSDAATVHGVYVQRGTSSSHNAPVRVGGTTNRDTNVVVTAPSSQRVLVSWQRHTASWSAGALGVWTTAYQYSFATKSWVFTTPQRHWARSAYDVPTAAFADPRGHLYVVFFSTRDDMPEW